MAINNFDAVHSDLELGVNLIEASAGTGKTYALAMLALRFIVEQDIAIERLLIVTFTNAATRELKERVRLRLIEARAALDGKLRDIDANIISWVKKPDIDKAQAKRRLDLALLDIDQAGIYTIHGFCQRVLREHALESGQLFDMELSADISAVRQTCADDFWRQQLYDRDEWTAALLMLHYKTPDALLCSIPDSNVTITVFPDWDHLDDKLSDLKTSVQAAAANIKKNAAIIENVLTENMFKAAFAECFPQQVQLLEAWLKFENTVPPEPETLALLTSLGLSNGLNGNKFRKNKIHSGEERKQAYLDELGIDSAPFEQVQAAVQDVMLTLRRALLEYLRDELEKRLLKLNCLSFDNLITRLYQVLQEENGIYLKTALSHRYQAVLIDEFQDTDHVQWRIFSTLFALPTHYLFLIGDPKQAIYKFRGADIFTYFAAQREAQHHYTLTKNWRSHPELVNAVNTLFAQENPFLFEQLQYHSIHAAFSAAQGELRYNQALQPPLQLWQLRPSESNDGYWTSAKAGEQIQQAVSNEILTLLDSKQGYTLGGENRTALLPRDIAILVRTNQQARDYQQALRAVGIPALLNSTESVYASPQAEELLFVLRAVAHPGDIMLLKQALTISWFNLDGQALYRIGNDEALLDDYLSRFQGYYQQWLDKGFMAMMQNVLQQEQVAVHLSQASGAERQLTNVQHLLELVQQASVDEHLGVNKTLDWLHRAILNEENGDAQQLRLESDAEAVTIVTQHRAKGLEYGIVFCPNLWYRSKEVGSNDESVTCHCDGEMIVDLGSADFARHRQQAVLEQQAEDLRLFYVALTRAKFRCYVIWADVRSKREANHSALARVLFAHTEMDYSTQQERLQAYCRQSPETFAYAELENEGVVNRRYQAQTEAALLHARQRTRQLNSHWQMSSYTALSALSLHEVPELPADQAQELPGVESLPEAMEQLPRGPHTGNVVHELLERIDFADLAEKVDISAMRDQICLRNGLKLQQPEILDELLYKVVHTPLHETDPGFTLGKLAQRHCLKEMPFYLALSDINVSAVNAILHTTPGFQSLAARQLQGYLTGFIDLICEYRGRYYVMDYKTNGLADYQPQSLTQAMRQHNYGLQYWLYTLVLHRYLQLRLPDYQYHSHFGGVRYLFVRGMQPHLAMSGVFADYPDLHKLQALATLFRGDK